ncbi:MAG: hypothetical protein ACE5GW_09045, partial [Planctomycetota bacterium]
MPVDHSNNDPSDARWPLASPAAPGAPGVPGVPGRELPAARWSALRLRRRIIIFSACALLLAILWIAARSPAFVEASYAGAIGPAIARGLGAV